MDDVFELRHQPAKRAVLHVRVWPLALTATLLSLIAASAVALATQDLDTWNLITAWFLVGGGTIAAALVLRRSWRIWPAASASLVVMRLDQEGPWLRKGRFRDDIWFHVPWSSIQAMAFTPFPVSGAANTDLRKLRLLRFVPDPQAHIPDGPPGAMDHVLRLPPRESVLAFVAVASWDDGIRDLLHWVRNQRPDVGIEDSVP